MITKMVCVCVGFRAKETGIQHEDERGKNPLLLLMHTIMSLNLFNIR